MRLLIDTNRYRDADQGDREVIGRFERASELLVPLAVLAELRGGFAHGDRREANEATLQQFLSKPHVRVLVPDEETTLYYASVWAELKGRGEPIPINDVWIAAQALQHNLVLDTRDTDFDRVPGLRLLEN